MFEVSERFAKPIWDEYGEEIDPLQYMDQFALGREASEEKSVAASGAAR